MVAVTKSYIWVTYTSYVAANKTYVVDISYLGDAMD